MKNSKFVIQPHFRLQEWVAEEKGYFKDEGLDYVFQETVPGFGRQGARLRRQERRDADLRERPHVGRQLRLPLDRRRRRRQGPRQALQRRLFGIARGHFRAGRLTDQNTRTACRRADLCRLSVRQPLLDHSGARAVSRPADKINLSFVEGMLFNRMELLLDGKVPAAALFSGPYYLAEQLGFRKVIDTTFMINTMINGDPNPEDIAKFFRALKRAQRDIDLRPELYTHYYRNEFPKRFHDRMDTRRWGPGERIVFEKYTKEVFDETFKWIADRGIFADTGMGTQDYAGSIATSAQ